MDLRYGGKGFSLGLTACSPTHSSGEEVSPQRPSPAAPPGTVAGNDRAFTPTRTPAFESPPDGAAARLEPVDHRYASQPVPLWQGLRTATTRQTVAPPGRFTSPAFPQVRSRRNHRLPLHTSLRKSPGTVLLRRLRRTVPQQWKFCRRVMRPRCIQQQNGWPCS